MKIRMMDFLKSHADKVVVSMDKTPNVYAMFTDENISFRAFENHNENDVIYCCFTENTDDPFDIMAFGVLSTHAELPDNLLSELDKIKTVPLRAMIEKRILKKKVENL